MVIGQAAFHKKISAVKRGVVQCRHFANKEEEEVLQMQTFALFGAKTSDFSKFLVCSHGHGAVQPVRTRREGDQFIAILCGCLLWAAPNSCLMTFKDCSAITPNTDAWVRISFVVIFC